MSVRFPAEPMYTGFNTPTRFEADVKDLPLIQGEVPKDLNGVFFRVQPDPVWPPKMGWDIPLNGDGLITAFYFNNGTVDFKSRFVRTDKYVAEQKAGRALFGVYRNPYTDDPSVEGLSRGTANTNVLWHGGKLMALKEDSLPVELDPMTLETKGAYDYEGQVTGLTFTAHPKLDPVTGELIAYGYEAKGLGTKDVAVYTIDKSGEVTKEEWLEVPYGCMIHDFGVTREHILVPLTPLWTNMEQIKAGGPHYSWDGQRPSMLGVYSRANGPSDIRWFEGPTCHATHTLNAYTDGRKIHYDTPTGDTAVFPFFPALHGEEWTPARSAPRLTRWTVDLDDNEGKITHTPLTDVIGDFPRIDERFGLSPLKKGWIVGLDDTRMDEKLRGPGSAMITNAIIEHDLETGERKSFYVGDNSSAQEPQFVPRRPDSPEGDGYLIMVLHRVDMMCSDLVILDANDIAAGPVATLRMPFKLRRGLHGCWAPAEQLQ